MEFYIMPEIELTNMCMIYNPENNKVVVQERVKKWKGISFPGGHVETGESIVESTVREIKEETGLTIMDLKPCGVIYWYNDQTGDRYFVFNYKTNKYTGKLLKSSEEGNVFWVDIKQLSNMNLAKGFKDRLPMFFEEKYVEGFATWNDQGSSKMIWR